MISEKLEQASLNQFQIRI